MEIVINMQAFQFNFIRFAMLLSESISKTVEKEEEIELSVR